MLQKVRRINAGWIAGIFLWSAGLPLFAADNARAGLAAPDTTAKYLAGLMVPAVSADASWSGAAPAPQTSETNPVSTAATPGPTPMLAPVPGSMIPRRKHAPVAADQPSPSTLNSSTSQPPVGNPWVMHSVELDRAWKRTGEQQLPAIAAWAPAAMGPAYQQTAPAFYMFSGPDFLYAHAFFPNASTYVLCGTEPIGAVPDLTNIPPDALPTTLANLRKSLESFLNWSFFITREMKTDLTKTQLNGTLPLLYVLLARTGCTIESVALVTLDRAGNVSETEKGEPSGVRIVFTAGSGAPQTLYYFCTDLSDDGVKSAPGFMAFCEQQGRGVSLLKAASYLMHENGFLRVRQFLLERSDVIVQDDSGIPIRYFEPRMWLGRYCGQYVGPIDMFKKYWQPDLDDAYRHSARQPLPFGFGYQWRPNRSDLLIAWRNQPIQQAEN